MFSVNEADQNWLLKSQKDFRRQEAEASCSMLSGKAAGILGRYRVVWVLEKRIASVVLEGAAEEARRHLGPHQEGIGMPY